MAPVRDAALELLATLDLEVLQDRLLAALGAAADAQGAALWVADDAGALVLRGLRGLVRADALPSRLGPDHPEVAAALRAGSPARGEALAPGAGWLLPLAHGGEVVGLALLEPAGAAPPPALQALAAPAALALRNARRFRALERASLRDRESGAYRVASFVDHAEKELHRARRYGRSFSVAVVTLDAGAAGDAGRARALGAAVARAVRDADVLARASDAEYEVLLPETDALGALAFRRRVAEELRREAALAGLRERVALGAATFPEDGDAVEALIEACRARQREERTSLLWRVPAAVRDAPAAFWELVDACLGATSAPGDARWATLPVAPELVDAVQREVARELARRPRERAAAYVSRRDAAEPPALAALPRVDGAARAGDAGARLHVVGPRGAAGGRGHPLAVEVAAEGEPRLAEHAFVIALSGRAAYALLVGPRGRAFHTCDVPLVDALVEKLHAHFDVGA